MHCYPPPLMTAGFCPEGFGPLSPPLPSQPVLQPPPKVQTHAIHPLSTFSLPPLSLYPLLLLSPTLSPSIPFFPSPIPSTTQNIISPLALSVHPIKFWIKCWEIKWAACPHFDFVSACSYFLDSTEIFQYTGTCVWFFSWYWFCAIPVMSRLGHPRLAKVLRR